MAQRDVAAERRTKPRAAARSDPSRIGRTAIRNVATPRAIESDADTDTTRGSSDRAHESSSDAAQRGPMQRRRQLDGARRATASIAIGAAIRLAIVHRERLPVSPNDLAFSCEAARVNVNASQDVARLRLLQRRVRPARRADVRIARSSDQRAAQWAVDTASWPATRVSPRSRRDRASIRKRQHIAVPRRRRLRFATPSILRTAITAHRTEVSRARRQRVECGFDRLMAIRRTIST